MSKYCNEYLISVMPKYFEKNYLPFLNRYEEFKDQGLSEKEIANAIGIHVVTMRRKKAQALSILNFFRLKEIIILTREGKSDSEIKELLDINDSFFNSLITRAKEPKHD